MSKRFWWMAAQALLWMVNAVISAALCEWFACCACMLSCAIFTFQAWRAT